VRPSLSPCRLRSRVSSSSNVRRALRNVPHSTPGWTRCWTMPCCGMGGPSLGKAGVVPCPSHLPRIYYTPSAAAHLDHGVLQRISGGMQDSTHPEPHTTGARAPTLLTALTGRGQKGTTTRISPLSLTVPTGPGAGRCILGPATRSNRYEGAGIAPRAKRDRPGYRSAPWRRRTSWSYPRFNARKAGSA
jgi:hypothetical protein